MVNIGEVNVAREINIIIIPAMTTGMYQNFERTYRNSILLLIIYYFVTYYMMLQKLYKTAKVLLGTLF